MVRIVPLGLAPALTKLAKVVLRLRQGSHRDVPPEKEVL